MMGLSAENTPSSLKKQMDGIKEQEGGSNGRNQK